MATRGRPPSSKTLVDRQLGRNVPHPILPAGDTYRVPNHSGDHSEGRVDRTPTQNLDLVNKVYVDDLGNLHVLKAGDTMTGTLTIEGGQLRLDNNFSVNSKDSGGSSRPLLLLNASDNMIIGGTTGIEDITYKNTGNANVLVLKGTTGFVGINTALPEATLDVNGGFGANQVAKTANYTATAADHTITCGAGNETFTITLPGAASVEGIIYNIKNVGTGTITVDGTGPQTIDGSTTAVLSTQFASITIQSSGSTWWIL